MRSLFHRNLKNVAGKMKTERRWKPVVVPEGVVQVCKIVKLGNGQKFNPLYCQNFTKFDCLSPTAEADKRFEFFTKQVIIS